MICTNTFLLNLQSILYWDFCNFPPIGPAFRIPEKLVRFKKRPAKPISKTDLFFMKFML